MLERQPHHLQFPRPIPQNTLDKLTQTKNQPGNNTKQKTKHIVQFLIPQGGTEEPEEQDAC
jgi:hypothetical protein